MEINVYTEKYKHLRNGFYNWRYELNLVQMLFLSLGFACLTGLVAQVRFYIPGTPVPITGQTFAVLLAGVILGRWGGASMLMYAGIGALGVPWFAPRMGEPMFSSGGVDVIFGSTGGYIIGFIFAAFFLGYFVDQHTRTKSIKDMLPLVFLANFVLIYIPGLLVLYLVAHPVSLWQLLMWGLIPFIVGDLIKIFAATGLAKGIPPRNVETTKTTLNSP